MPKTKSDNTKRIIKYNLLCIALAFPLITALEYLIPAFKISFKLYNVIYSLNNFSTIHLDFSKLFVYIFFLISGFAFINIVNLQKSPKNPFISPNGYSDFKKSILIGILLFFISGNFLLLGKYDFEGFCPEGTEIQNISYDTETFYSKIKKHFSKISNFEKITHSISLGLYAFCKDLSTWFNPSFYFIEFTPVCKFPVFFERVFKNFFFFAIPFIISLNFTYVEEFPGLRDFNLSWEYMKFWSWKLWGLFFIMCGFILFTVSFLFLSFLKNSLIRLSFYASLLLVIGLYVIIRSKREAPVKHFHLHHYMLMIVFCLFLGIHSDFCLIIFGVFSAIMIEGSCRWGMDPCWTDSFQDLK